MYSIEAGRKILCGEVRCFSMRTDRWLNVQRPLIFSCNRAFESLSFSEDQNCQMASSSDVLPSLDRLAGEADR